MPPSLHKSEVQKMQLHISLTAGWPSKLSISSLQKSFFAEQPCSVTAKNVLNYFLAGNYKFSVKKLME
jgi:hypothetical protein